MNIFQSIRGRIQPFIIGESFTTRGIVFDFDASSIYPIVKASHYLAGMKDVCDVTESSSYVVGEMFALREESSMHIFRELDCRDEYVDINELVNNNHIFDSQVCGYLLESESDDLTDEDEDFDFNYHMEMMLLNKIERHDMLDSNICKIRCQNSNLIFKRR